MPVTPSYEEKEILRRVSEGEEKAFEQVYLHYSPHIYGAALAYGKSEVLAGETVQEVFLKIWLNRQSLTHIEHFENYLFILARNQILNRLKRKLTEQACLRQMPLFSGHSNMTPEDVLLLKEAGMLVNRAIGELPSQQRMVYQMARQEGLKLEEIALRLGLSRNTVKNHLARARESIRVHVSKHSGELVMLLATSTLV